MTVQQIIQAIEDGIQLCGEYKYFDYGPHETVISYDEIIRSLKTGKPEDAKELLLELLIYGKEHCSGDGVSCTTACLHQQCTQFVSDALTSLQDVPDFFWDVLISAPELWDLT